MEKAINMIGLKRIASVLFVLFLACFSVYHIREHVKCVRSHRVGVIVEKQDKMTSANSMEMIDDDLSEKNQSLLSSISTSTHSLSAFNNVDYNNTFIPQQFNAANGVKQKRSETSFLMIFRI